MGKWTSHFVVYIMGVASAFTAQIAAIKWLPPNPVNTESIFANIDLPQSDILYPGDTKRFDLRIAFAMSDKQNEYACYMPTGVHDPLNVSTSEKCIFTIANPISSWSPDTRFDGVGAVNLYFKVNHSESKTSKTYSYSMQYMQRPDSSRIVPLFDPKIIEIGGTGVVEIKYGKLDLPDFAACEGSGQIESFSIIRSVGRCKFIVRRNRDSGCSGIRVLFPDKRQIGHVCLW